MKENTSNNSFTISYHQKAFCTLVLAICCLLLSFSCKTKKPLAARKPAADTTVAVKAVDLKLLKINAIKSAQTVFNTFSGKARTKLTINGEANDVTLNIRVLHDKKIWVSITAIAGLEAARAVITPDSIMIINRLQNMYVKQPFSYVNKYAGSQVNYKTIESVLVGNALPEALNESSDIQPDGVNTVLTGNLSGLIYKLVLGSDNKVNQLNLSNPDEGQSMLVTNSVFVQVGSRVLPSVIDMASVVKNKKIQVNLHYIKEDFDLTLDFPFTIPARYTPAE
ncbi:MAG TPA: DUF4292 domain-containing protein [Mucilaginibacter sp.]|jgi:hypothetical protein|nr:DUF4292 domain-containing protein [Mucilaginibacter sp.]